MVDNDPTIPVEAIRNGVRVHRYVPGAHGTAVGDLPGRTGPAGSRRRRAARPGSSRRRGCRSTPSSRTTSASGSWSTSWSSRNHPRAGDPELLGLLAAVGIVHGKPFEPDARMRKILEDAVVVGNATARTVTFAAATRGGLRLLPELAMAERAVRRWLPVPRPAPADHRRRPRRRPERRCPQTQLRHQLLLHGHRHHAGDVHASHRHRLAVHLRDARQRRQLPRRCAATIASPSRPTSPRAGSGR